MPSGTATAWQLRRGSGRKEREAERHQAGARCCRIDLRVVDQRDAAFFEIAAGLAGDVVERRAKAGNERDRGSVGAFALDGVLALLAQVEVIARVLGLLHRRPGAFADAEIGEARRNHDRFLRAADEDVDAPAVDVEMRGAEAGDAVDDQERHRAP